MKWNKSNMPSPCCRRRVKGFIKFFSISFLWACFQWFYTGGERCGFSQFPTFGLQAWRNSWVFSYTTRSLTSSSSLLFLIGSVEICRFYFDFSATYVGAGMICSHLVNLSLLLGAVLSWGIMWPLIRGLQGEWFPESLPESSMKSLNGYKV